MTHSAALTHERLRLSVNGKSLSVGYRRRVCGRMISAKKGRPKADSCCAGFAAACVAWTVVCCTACVALTVVCCILYDETDVARCLFHHTLRCHRPRCLRLSTGRRRRRRRRRRHRPRLRATALAASVRITLRHNCRLCSPTIVGTSSSGLSAVPPTAVTVAKSSTRLFVCLRSLTAHSSAARCSR